MLLLLVVVTRCDITRGLGQDFNERLELLVADGPGHSCGPNARPCRCSPNTRNPPPVLRAPISSLDATTKTLGRPATQVHDPHPLAILQALGHVCARAHTHGRELQRQRADQAHCGQVAEAPALCRSLGYSGSSLHRKGSPSGFPALPR